jgi:hypothetical protein
LFVFSFIFYFFYLFRCNGGNRTANFLYLLERRLFVLTDYSHLSSISRRAIDIINFDLLCRFFRLFWNWKKLDLNLDLFWLIKMDDWRRIQLFFRYTW